MVLKFGMQNYNLDDLYVVSIVKINKDLINSKEILKNCIELVGYAIVTKSQLIPKMFVDIYSKEFYEPFRMNIEVGKICYSHVQTMASMFGDRKEQLARARQKKWNCVALIEVLRYINRDSTDFLHHLLDEEDEKVDISKMN